MVVERHNHPFGVPRTLLASPPEHAAHPCQPTTTKSTGRHPDPVLGIIHRESVPRWRITGIIRVSLR